MKKFEIKGAQKLDRIHNILGGAVDTVQYSYDKEISEIDPDCRVCGLGGPILTGTGTCGTKIDHE